jgi:Leucine-rich repeat (LRR) protein
MNTYIFTVILLCWSAIVFGQTADTTLLTREQLDTCKVYTNLDEALRHPENVFILNLSGQNLTKLPESIGSFSNLQVLHLGYGIKKSTPKKVLQQAERIGGGILHLDRGTGKYLEYNRLRELPDTIANLKKLQYLNLYHNDFDEVPMILKELKSLQYINFYDCYGLIDNKAQIDELQAALGPGCKIGVVTKSE